MFYKVPQSEDKGEETYTTAPSVQREFELYCREHQYYSVYFQHSKVQREMGNLLNSNNIIVEYVHHRAQEFKKDLNKEDLSLTTKNLISTLEDNL